MPQTVAAAARPEPDTVLLNEELRLAPGYYGSWGVSLASARLVKLNLTIRSNQPVDYYWMPPEEVEAFGESKRGGRGRDLLSPAAVLW